MKILFDQGTPAPLRRHLTGNMVDTTAELGWSEILNGELLKLAEQNGYSAFVTTDQSIRYQQSLKTRKIGIVVLMSTAWPKVQLKIPEILAAVNRIAIGTYEEVQI